MNMRLEEKLLCLGEVRCFNRHKTARGLNSRSKILQSSQSASFFSLTGQYTAN